MFTRRVYDIRPTEPPPSPPLEVEHSVDEEFVTRPASYQGRFHYLEDQPMEVTDSLKGYSFRNVSEIVTHWWVSIDNLIFIFVKTTFFSTFF